MNLTATVKRNGGAAPTGTVTFVTSLDFALGSAQLTGGAAPRFPSPRRSVLAGDGKVYALYSGDAVYGSSVGTVTHRRESAGLGIAGIGHGDAESHERGRGARAGAGHDGLQRKGGRGDHG